MDSILTRIRITFAKTEAMRFTGHLDLHRTWERTFRRARLPVAYKQGFNPQPRINLACALPLGITSNCELLDVWFDQPVTPAALEIQLMPALPPGLEVLDIQEINLSAPALQTQVTSSTYLISVENPLPGLPENCRNLIESPSVVRQWRGKEYDLRPLVLDLRLRKDAAGTIRDIEVILSAQEGATGRPEEVAAALGLSIGHTRIQRTHLALSTSVSSQYA